MKVAETKKVKRLVMTTIKVRVPFGISSNKFEEKPTTYQGPDFYSKTSSWTKPTFNIKGKLQSWFLRTSMSPTRGSTLL